MEFFCFLWFCCFTWARTYGSVLSDPDRDKSLPALAKNLPPATFINASPLSEEPKCTTSVVLFLSSIMVQRTFAISCDMLEPVLVRIMSASPLLTRYMLTHIDEPCLIYKLSLSNLLSFFILVGKFNNL